MSKVVLITGASSGLGKALASHLSAMEYKVYGSSRKPDRSNMPFAMVSLDVTDTRSVTSAVRQVVQQEGRIDVLINNAGVSMAAPLEMVPLEDVQQLFNTNVCGVLRVCQAVLPHMRAAGNGMIINISSIGGSIGLPFRAPYCASKAAVDILSEALRMEVKNFGIQVCAVPAGDMQTPIHHNWIGTYRGEDEVYGEAYRKVTAAAQAGNSKGMAPEEVARQIERIIRSGRAPGKKVIGPPLQRLAITAKRILPSSLFEKMIMQHSKL